MAAAATTATSYQAGDVVWTKYGAGVIVGAQSTEDSKDAPSTFSVRLWRHPGKSIGSAAVAYFDQATILERLPVAPGMVTSIAKTQKEGEGGGEESKAEDGGGDEDRVLVHSYYRHTNTYLVSKVASEDGGKEKESDGTTETTSTPAETNLSFWTVQPHELNAAPSAKFYPILETLMVRGDQTAQQATQFLQREQTQKLISTTQGAIQSKFANTQETIAQADVGTRLDDLTNTVEEAVTSNAPSEPQIKQVLSIVKDQELTELLQNCRERLEQLVQTEIPKATQQALEKTGIRIKLPDGGGGDGNADADDEKGSDGTLSVKSFSASMDASRKAALTALNDLLAEADVDPAQLEKVRSDVTQKFSQTFDSLATAAKSDRGLHDLFESVADKTTVWQQATGRLLQTRSASLFMEGASRLQARAATIFQMQWQGGGEIGSKLTKAFTEKDAALARLKSIQLGDAVKNRLVEAIEVRSESLGGLDGIIAGALSRVRTTGQQSGEKMKQMLSTMQASASTATTDAHETLISVLSHRSMYRDVALLRIERVFCELESHLGDDLRPEDIAAIARGEGGTAKLFEPIAKRAVQEVEKQLDAAEAQITDKTMLEVLKRVRKITSGELTVAALTEELVGILNDDTVIAASETIMVHGEQVLDVIEGVSSNKVVNDAQKILEKAGITKDTMMKEIEKLDVDQLLDTAGGAVTDESKRRQLISSATDTALDFILRILPSMPVPPFDGVRDGLVYNISNLSMEGFKVKKEDIQIELAGMRATKRRASSMKRMDISTPDEDDDDGADDATPVIHQTLSGESVETLDVEEISSDVKATELLIIDVKRISATLDNAAWSFEQTYLPYLKGNGLADVKLSNGAIRLQFELRKRKKTKTSKAGDETTDNDKETTDNDKDAVEWEPVLCLHDRTCSIHEVDLSLQGEGRITWIFNKLASVFKGPLRDYVVRTIVKVLTNQSGWILERMNTILSPYWDLILQTAKLKMEELVEADDDVVVKAEDVDTSLVELVWRQRLPLGMNLLMNDESGKLKVVDFPRGSQARLVCEKRNYNPDLFKGATIVGVNGTLFDVQDELFEALKDPARPKTVQFRLAESAESERVRRFVEGPTIEEDDQSVKPRKLATRVIEFTKEGELGIVFEPAIDNCGLIVDGFLEGSDGIILAAERSNDIQLGDLLTHINGELVVGTKGQGRQKSLQLLEQVANIRPLSLTFSRSYQFREIIDKPDNAPGETEGGGPTEIVLTEEKNDDGTRRVLIKHFNPVSGAVETSGILIGDHLVFVNGTPVGAGARWLGESQGPTLEEVYEMLCDKSFYPIGLTFARPKNREASAVSRWATKSEEPFSDFDADTICVTCDQQNRLGCIFDTTENGDIVISDFNSVPGVFHRRLARYTEMDGKFHVAIDSVNGQFVPSYATKDMVMNALKRSWKNDKSVEIILCDDERRQYIQSLE